MPHIIILFDDEGNEIGRYSPPHDDEGNRDSDFPRLALFNEPFLAAVDRSIGNKHVESVTVKFKAK